MHRRNSLHVDTPPARIHHRVERDDPERDPVPGRPWPGSAPGAAARALARADRAWDAFDRKLVSNRIFALAVSISMATALTAWMHDHSAIGWHDLFSGDAREYALVARRVAQGEGLTTPVIFAAALPRFGAEADHPSLVRPPLWPLLEAGALRVSGMRVEALHVLLLASFAGATALAMALAGALAGRAAAVVTGLAVATCGAFRLFAIDVLTEPLFALWLCLALLLHVRRAPSVAVGVVCGLSYLTRDVGSLLLASLALVTALEPHRVRRGVGLLLGFALMAAPRWLWSYAATGEPFFSLYNLSAWADPNPIGFNSQPFYQLDPPVGEVLSRSLWKLGALLPVLAAKPPFVAANFVAFGAVVLGALRRDRASLAFLVLSAATLLAMALAVPLARYFAPLVPPMLAIGVAAAARFAGRWRVPLIVAIVLAPLVPSPIGELDDLALFRQAVRARTAGVIAPDDPAARERQAAARRICLSGRPRIVAEDASRIAWQTDAIAIHLPGSRRDFWRIVDGWDVDFVQIRRLRWLPEQELLERFEPRPECGPDLYARRAPRT